MCFVESCRISSTNASIYAMNGVTPIPVATRQMTAPGSKKSNENKKSYKLAHDEDAILILDISRISLGAKTFCLRNFYQ